jgi:sarcosine oxidase subunit beta
MKKANIVIIGAGINGVSTAYYLAKRGFKNIVVVEKSYVCSGATGRCGAGIRQQWSTEENTLLAMEAVKLFEGLEEELRWDIEYEQCGYLIPAFTEQFEEQFKKNVEMQKKLGLEVYYLQPEEIKEVVPDINLEGIRCATYCPTDGGANPQITTYAYAQRARELGVEILTHTEVKDIIVENGKIKKVITTKGEIETPRVLNTAGGFSQQIAKMVGIELPINSYRHQILVTEPVHHFFDPMIISFDYNIYFRQVENGSILMGCGDPDEKPSFNTRATFSFLRDITPRAIKLMPKLRNLNIVRHWAGLYNVTPDAMPILGDVSEVEGYYQAVGFSGHGFMLGPKVATLMAELIAEGKRDSIIERLGPDRFSQGEIQRDTSVV